MIIYSTPTASSSTISPLIPSETEAKLGRGLSIPLQIINNVSSANQGLVHTQQDLYMCLSTPVGLRMGQPDYGSMIPYYLWEKFTPLTSAYLVNSANKAIKAWMPQISNSKVLIDSSSIVQNFLQMTVQYSVYSSKQAQAMGIVLSLSNKLQFPPNVFVINGKPLFKAA